MANKSYRPTTNARRGMSVSDFNEVTKKEPERSLVRTHHRKAGRNNQGRITSRHRSTGHKRRYRIVDFRRDKDGVPATVAAIEYDPNRSARLALLNYHDGEKRYILAPRGVAPGMTIISGEEVDVQVGNAMPLYRMPLGTTVHAVEVRPGGGATMARSAGSSVQLLAKEGKNAALKLPSGEIRLVDSRCRATVGAIGNEEHENLQAGKAGRSRWKGRRPRTRGVAMNPVDHPLGGGEGHTAGGRHPTDPWGNPERRTRKKNKKSDRQIIRRRGESQRG